MVFVTMLYSMNKIKKENTIDVLKNDKFTSFGMVLVYYIFTHITIFNAWKLKKLPH